MFGGPCMLTMACYPRDVTCAYHILFFLHTYTHTYIFDKNNDHTFHYLAQKFLSSHYLQNFFVQQRQSLRNTRWIFAAALPFPFPSSFSFHKKNFSSLPRKKYVSLMAAAAAPFFCLHLFHKTAVKFRKLSSSSSLFFISNLFNGGVGRTDEEYVTHSSLHCRVWKETSVRLQCLKPKAATWYKMK